MLVMQTADLRQQELVQKEPKPIRKANGGKTENTNVSLGPQEETFIKNINGVTKVPAI